MTTDEFNGLLVNTINFHTLSISHIPHLKTKKGIFSKKTPFYFKPFGFVSIDTYFPCGASINLKN